MTTAGRDLAAHARTAKARPLITTFATTLAGRFLFGALLVAMAMSPFEAGYPPLGHFLVVTLTNLEAALLLLAGAWAIKLALDPAARRRLLANRLLPPFAVLVTAAGISALFGEYSAMGGHYIYRLLMGATVCFAAVEAITSRRRLFAALGTFVVAGSVAALLGLLEFAPWINMEPWLAIFKPMPTTVGGLLRLSGSFEYANGAAMYFEMALPVLLGLFISTAVGGRDALFGQDERGKRLRRAARLALLALLGIYALALLLTLSRAALAGFAVALVFIGLVALLRRRREPSLPMGRLVLRPLGVALAVMLLAGIYILLTQPMFSVRLTTENDRSWYVASLSAGPVPNIPAGDVETVPVTVRNDGQMVWRAEGTLRVNVGYHWLSADKRTYVVYDGARTALPHDLAPGESATLLAFVRAPQQPGDYYLEWDLVQENVTWFSMKNKVAPEPVAVAVGPQVADGRPRPAPQAGAAGPIEVADIANVDTSTVSRLELWRVALSMFAAHPISGVGPDGFRILYGKYAGVTEWNSNIYTNNTYLEMFTNLGLLGGLAFLWLAAAGLWPAWRNLLGRPVSAAWAAGVGVTAALVAFFIHGLADYFLFSTPMYTVFWFLLGVAALWPHLSSQATRDAHAEG